MCGISTWLDANGLVLEGQHPAGERQREAAAGYDNRARYLDRRNRGDLRAGVSDCADHAANVRRIP